MFKKTMAVGPFEPVMLWDTGGTTVAYVAFLCLHRNGFAMMDRGTSLAPGKAWRTEGGSSMM